MSKTLVIGGTGTLGKALKEIDPELICLARNECEIRYLTDIGEIIQDEDPDVIILAAAILTNGSKLDLIRTNVIGAGNVAAQCFSTNTRLVYISSDYVYPSEDGNYKESDPLLPVNDYAWSKLGGECAVRMVPNHLIIRTSFGKSECPYEFAHNNQWTSKDYVDIIAPMVLQAAKSDLKGVLNIGTEKKTIFDLMSRRNKVIGKPVTDNLSPRDSSLNLDKWKAFQKSIPNADVAETNT